MIVQLKCPAILRAFMKIAIIDMGTNTFHLMLANVGVSSFEIFFKDRVPVKIGEKGINKGQITGEAWDRALEAIHSFSKKVNQEKIDQVFATATSAIRNASNGLALTREIEKQTGIKTRIISGQQEAELILKGAREALDFGAEKSLIMDIGGGSIEFIIANSQETFWLKSFEIGGQRLVEKFHHHDPIAQEELNQLHNYFLNELSELIDQCIHHAPQTLIGCSGTFDTLSDIHQARLGLSNDPLESEFPLPIESFNEIYQELLKKTREERLQIPGMIEMRVDMIVVACALVDFIIKEIGIQKLRVSAFALKEGVLLDTIETVRKSMRSN